MSSTWIKVYKDGNLNCTVPLNCPFELGRQKSPNEALYTPSFQNDVGRLAIAPEPIVKIPRKFLRVLPLSSGQVRIENVHDSAVLFMDGGTSLRPRHSIDARPGVLLILDGGVAIRFEEPIQLSAIGTPTLAPIMGAEAFRNGAIQNNETLDSAKLIQWFQAVIIILQSASSSKDLFRQSVDALVRLVGMDNGAVVLWNSVTNKWTTIDRQSSTGLDEYADEWMPSQQILMAARSKREALFHVPSGVDPTRSAEQLSGFVVAPILADDSSLIGVLYGERRRDRVDRPDVSTLDAQLAQTIACAVATGLLRIERERRVAEEQARFEQFFTVELARSLTADPQLLDGRDADVTCLFCDIRGFSRISERLGPQEVMQWIQTVMGVLSDCVASQKGVLIDYIGDELFAMWGAPEPELDHAARACAAARLMLNCIPQLNEEWRSRLGTEFSVGIGVHTGRAHVGNTGSQRKLKYGPLGNTVNLASRVQGATKYLRTNILVTADTRRRMQNCEDFRRLCKIRVVNINEPVELYDLPMKADADWSKLKTSYEAALLEFEAHDYRGAMRRLMECLEIAPDDGPSVLLLSRSVTAMGEGHGDDAWVLPGK